MRGFVASSLAALVAAAAPSALADCPRFSARNFPTGLGPNSVAVADFNGDGKADLAVLNETLNNVGIHLGDGAGAFANATTYSAGAHPSSVAVGDFNGGGRV